DFTIPQLVFGHAERDGDRLYSVRSCTADPGPIALNDDSDFSIVVPNNLSELEHADTIVIPGTMQRTGVDERVLDALREASKHARIVSICTGAFVVAAAGLLDGLRATTYWRRTEEFARLFPHIALDPGVLYVDEGRVLTSAGLAAGIDLCLHIVAKDF